MLNIAIVEDEKAAADNLCACLTRYTKDSGESFNIKVFDNGVKFLTGYQSNFDIVFMDIDMPDMDGLSAARKLRELDGKVVLIFVTNLAQFAIKGYEVDAMDYMLKPLNYPAFALKIKKAIRHCEKNETKEVYVTTGNGEVRFAASSVIFVEINVHHIVYHTESGDYPAYGTMKKVEQSLPAEGFYKCNSCYMVSLRHVSSVNGFTVTVGGHELIISHPRKKQFMEALHRYYGNVGGVN